VFISHSVSPVVSQQLFSHRPGFTLSSSSMIWSGARSSSPVRSLFTSCSPVSDCHRKARVSPAHLFFLRSRFGAPVYAASEVLIVLLIFLVHEPEGAGRLLFSFSRASAPERFFRVASSLSSLVRDSILFCSLAMVYACTAQVASVLHF
jgi:hypothetical protein